MDLEEFKGKYVRVYTDAPKNPVFAGKLIYHSGDEYIELYPGFNEGDVIDRVKEVLETAIQTDPALKLGLNKEEADELYGALAIPKVAERIGEKVKINLERVIAVTELKKQE